jgi:transposase
MGFYRQQHAFYCGVDLHARTMYVCVIDAAGKTVVHKNVKACAEDFLMTIMTPRREDLVVAVEATFNWYWLADVCRDYCIPFVLGHPLAMRAIHGSKTKNDRADSEKIARLLRGGNFPLAYNYPREIRSTRDLLRRRNCFVRRRAKLMTHLRHLNAQWNLAALPQNLLTKKSRDVVRGQFSDECTKRNAAADMSLLECYTANIRQLEEFLEEHAKIQDAATFYRLQTVPGIGRILALTIMYEVGDIGRFATVGDFLSYARLVPGRHESAGKNYGSPGRKMGNSHLKWAFSEVAIMFLKQSPQAKQLVDRLVKRHSKGKALGILAARLGRVVYRMLEREEPFDIERFFRLPQRSAVRGELDTQTELAAPRR